MRVLRIGHSPDPDDAFMFYALAMGTVAIQGYEVEQVLEDIESLNRRAIQGELEVTAISAAAYPRLATEYRIMACGASVGRSYGPVLIARNPLDREGLEGKIIGIPGEYTTAYLLLRIFLARPFTPVFLPFDSIGEAVTNGSVDAGLIIHEGQITWEAEGYVNVLDLGEEWTRETGLPIPLGLDVVHRRLGESTANSVAEALRASIRYAFSHEDAAVDYALQYGRGIDRETCRRFVRMYVNGDTINLGEDGLKALQTLYGKALDRKLIPTVPPLDIIGM